MIKVTSIVVSLVMFWGATPTFAEENLNIVNPAQDATLSDDIEDGIVLAQGKKKKKKKKKKPSEDSMSETTEKSESAPMSSSGGYSYGTAGCGLGSIVFGDKPGFMQVVAATLNGTGYQTFGITTGTSNCGSGGKSSAYEFIKANKVALASEISRGQGEAIESLSKILDCSDSKAVGSVLQKNFINIYPNEMVTAEQVGGAIFEALKNQSSDNLTCNIVG